MKTENIFDSGALPLALLVSVITPEMSDREAAVSLDELEKLLETAGGQLFATVVQQRSTPDNKTYLGKGKLEEIRELCQNNGVELLY